MKDNQSQIKKGAKAGLVSGILASLCCTAPIIVLFGLGTVSFALSISQLFM